MTLFLKSGTQFSVTTEESMDLHDMLPAGTYTVGFDQMSGRYFLVLIEGFEIKGKVYGDTKRNSDRIRRTFADRPNSTGVLLTGEKGSGKTLLAKMLSIDAAAEGIPTIVINQAWHGEEFNKFMQMIEQPVIVIFDEFEKVYEKEEQERLLTLFDGIYPSKKLFVITSNDKWRINEHMRNRPGRIFYRIDYKGLENDFIMEYCQDNLLNKDHIDSICRIAVLFSEFNFDMLKAMVEEMNRYGETAQEVLQILNAKPENNDIARYDVTLEILGLDLTEDSLEDNSWAGNPLNNTIRIDYMTGKKDKDDDDEDEWERALFEAGDLHRIDPATGKFTFINKKGDKVTLAKMKEKVPNWDMAF